MPSRTSSSSIRSRCAAATPCTVDEMPFKRPLEALGEEIHFDSGDYHALLDKHARPRRMGPAERASSPRRREKGEMVGVGLAMFVEKAGLGPADGVRIQVDTSGAVEVITGGASIGQGFETVMAQVAAEVLGTDYRKMRVIHGQTDRIEHGIGAHASRATVMTASATRVAALKVREKALDIAAELLQAPVDTLDIVDGEVVVTGPQGRPVDFARPDRGGARHRARSCAATASRGCPPKAGSTPTIRSIPTATISRW